VFDRRFRVVEIPSLEEERPFEHEEYVSGPH
jgi:hypothetical protein